MATPSEKLATSLELLRKLQKDGMAVVRSADLTRTHLERLKKGGFLQEVMRGWYISSRPDEQAGESSAWYTSFWQFCGAYLKHRFGDEWNLSPEQSISIHTENMTVPTQLIVRAVKGQNNINPLRHNTSLLEVKSPLPDKRELIEKNGLRIYSLPAALVGCSDALYHQNPTDIRAALAMIKDASEVLEILLDGGRSVVAGRLAGAFRNIGRNQIADEILSTMRSADYIVREQDPFEALSPIIFSTRELSPYVNRIRLMWHNFREVVIARFPVVPGISKDAGAYLKRIDEIYVTDAYHSLSIEGYRVSRELIDRVRNGDWNPDDIQEDQDHRSALAARGYWQASLLVKESIRKVLDGENPGAVASEDHRAWYREMFAPSVTAGILEAADLAGYRNAPVYLKHSMHVPPSREAVRDAMPALFELLENEPEVSVRVVLGHFFFVYIHPYMDGNGRSGRFLMNLMMASGGFPWLVIPVEERNAYMASLEAVTRQKDIAPFTDLLVRLINGNS